MAKCEICEKEKVFSMQVSHSHRRSARTWKPNLRSVKAIMENGETKRIHVCAKCLKNGKVKRA